jgi:preprotein translocase subunit SecF
MKLKLVIIPIVILIACLAYFFLTDLNLDIDLSGGNQISISSTQSVQESTLEEILKEFDADVRIARGITGYSILIDFDSSISPNDVLDKLNEAGYNFKDYSIQTIAPAIGGTFFQQATIALLIAFIFMAIAVFIIFKSILPSSYVILAAFADIIETLVLSQIIGIELSLATFSALLLLLGYSVDTDILLTTRVLRTKEGEVKSRVKGAMKTGLTMVGATAVALIALLVISASSVITQIASILLIGLMFDVVNTWLLNAPLLRWYVGRKK